MTWEWKVGRCSRRCHSQDRPLRPGEVFFSVVVEDGDQLVRHDYSAEAWEGPPEGTLGWWKGRMPEAAAAKRKLAPDSVLVDLLRQMADDPPRRPARYLLALLLLRRRVVREEESSDDPSSETPGMRLSVAVDGETIDVTPCEIPPAELAAVREELEELLYTEAE